MKFLKGGKICNIKRKINSHVKGGSISGVSHSNIASLKDSLMNLNIKKSKPKKRIVF